MKRESETVAESDETLKKQKRGIFETLISISNIAFTIAANVLLGVVIGLFLDRLLSSGPWLLIVFSLLGVASAVWSIFSLSTSDERKEI